MANPLSPTSDVSPSDLFYSSKNSHVFLEATGMSSPPQSLSIESLVDQSPSTIQNITDQTSLMPFIGVQASKNIQQPPLTDKIPIVSANSISVSISLAESTLYLTGFQQNDVDSGAPAILRGSLIVRVTKAEKIKRISLHFLGKSRTEWPEGKANPLDPDIIDVRLLTRIFPKVFRPEGYGFMRPFFDAHSPMADAGPGADFVRLHDHLSQSTGNEAPLPAFEEASDDSRHVGRYRAEHPFLQLGFLGNFGKDQSVKSQVVIQTGYRLFHPGDYVYNFELILDPHLPESIDIEHGKVEYNLEFCVERDSVFRHNLSGTKRISLIRSPAEGSLEQAESIIVNRDWEDQLRIEIAVSGKSFSLGSQIPVAIELTPLAKARCHGIDVFVTENIEYWTHDRKAHRLVEARKIHLFAKQSNKSSSHASANNDSAADQADNLLNSLDDVKNAGPTLLEFSIQLPICASTNGERNRLHPNTTFNDIQVHHWIKIILSLSKQEKSDPGKWRHVELSINSPFRIISCRASPPNIALPAYHRSTKPSSVEQMCCCSTASRRKLKTCDVKTVGSEKTPAGRISRRFEMVQEVDADGGATITTGISHEAPKRARRHSNERPDRNADQPARVGGRFGDFLSAIALSQDMMPR